MGCGWGQSGVWAEAGRNGAEAGHSSGTLLTISGAAVVLTSVAGVVLSTASRRRSSLATAACRSSVTAWRKRSKTNPAERTN